MMLIFSLSHSSPPQEMTSSSFTGCSKLKTEDKTRRMQMMNMKRTNDEEWNTKMNNCNDILKLM